MKASGIAEYYARRAAEYERIYARPERQDDLRTLRDRVARLLADHDVLEIACGTGYWTRVIAPRARSILATDVGAEVLEIAVRSQRADRRSAGEGAAVKAQPAGDARSVSDPILREETGPADRPACSPQPASPPGPCFVRADAFDLGRVEGRFTAGFAGFWWSHLRKDEIARFLESFHARLGGCARVLFIDNRYVEGSSTPISRTDEEGNTYQRRRLDDGSENEIVKNFPAPAELRAAVGGSGRAVEIAELTYYWTLSYEVVCK